MKAKKEPKTVIAFDETNRYLADLRHDKVNEPLIMYDGTIHKKVWLRGGCVFL